MRGQLLSHTRIVVHQDNKTLFRLRTIAHDNTANNRPTAEFKCFNLHNPEGSYLGRLQYSLNVAYATKSGANKMTPKYVLFHYKPPRRATFTLEFALKIH